MRSAGTSGSMSMQSAVGAMITMDGRDYVNFGGSSYLGLASHPEIVEAGIATLRECGAGVPIPWTHHISTRALREAEAEAALFFTTESALYLTGGYHFGLAAVPALRKDFGAVFFDEFSHYALRDGIAAAGIESYSFRHLDSEDLRTKLKAHLRGAGTRPLVATDGLYSTFGKIPPLDEFAQAISPYGGRLLVDESHSFGVLGATGRGALEHFHLDARKAIVGGSLGKAFGTCGGIIPATEAEVTAYRRTPVGLGASVGLPAAAAMCARSLKYVREHPALLTRLRENVAYLKTGLRNLGLDVDANLVPIAAFKVSEGQSISSIKKALMAEGIFVYHSTYIGAGEGGVVRCGIFADHTREHMDMLIQTLRRLL